MTTRSSTPDTILSCGKFTTLDRSKPTASAVAITNGVFTAVGACVPRLYAPLYS
jgi:predicted amidohydrolase YtcJ